MVELVEGKYMVSCLVDEAYKVVNQKVAGSKLLRSSNLDAVPKFDVSGT